MLRRDPYFLTDQKRWLKRIYVDPKIRLIGPPVPPPNPMEIRLFLIVRNEMLRLPHMLKYHFDMGVDRAVVLDNQSNDGTREWLLEQPNVHLCVTQDSFIRKEAWFDVLLRRYGNHCWCLLLDADELLVYPDIESKCLKDLLCCLEAEGVDAMSTVLLDLYPSGPISKAGYISGMPFVDAAPFFDPPRFQKTPFHHRGGSTPYPYRLEGGVRKRVFGEETCCTKVPLLRFHRRMFSRDGQHEVEFAHIGSLMGALLHFKFFQDFAPRASIEADRGVHYNGASHYQRYREYLDRTGELLLRNEESIRYSGHTSQLVELGIMQTTALWRAWRPADGH